MGIRDYLRNELAVTIEDNYTVLQNLYSSWSADRSYFEGLNVTKSLKQVLITNPSLKVFVANGYFDLATPYFASKYTFSHLGLSKEIQKNITFINYPGGHMMYTEKTSFEALAKDLKSYFLN